MHLARCMFVLAALFACHAAASIRQEQQLPFDRYCAERGTKCTATVPFWPPFNETTGQSCFWQRLEVDLPKYSTWTLDMSSISLRSPRNASCSVASVSLSGNDIFELEAPTLDCFRADGCVCSSLTPQANKAIHWKPVTQLLKRPITRYACRAARTYVYIRLQCTLTPITDTTDMAPYRQDPITGAYEAPATLSFSWTRHVNSSSPAHLNDIRSYCRTTARHSPAAYNRAFLLFLSCASAILVLTALALALLRWLWASLRNHLNPTPGPRPAQPLAAGNGSSPPPALSSTKAAPPCAGMWSELFRVDHHNGRDRTFTALLVAAVGIYIAGVLFEPAIKAQNAYERAISPFLSSATSDLAVALHLRSYSSFARKFLRLILTIMLCTCWGASVFGALLYNLSARPYLPTRRQARIFTLKLLVSCVSLLLLDVGLGFHLSGNFSTAPRWNQPAAYHFLLIITLLLYIAVHVRFVLLCLWKPNLQKSRRLSEVKDDLHLAKLMDQLRNQLPPTDTAPTQDNVIHTTPFALQDTPSNAPTPPVPPQPTSVIVAADVAADPELGKPFPYPQQTLQPVTTASQKAGQESAAAPQSLIHRLRSLLGATSSDQASDQKGKEAAPPLGQKLRALTEKARAALREEGRAFRYSPWFIAPMVISLVLLLFFFIRILYTINSVQRCLGASGCPRWTPFNSALVPVITSVFHAALGARSGGDFVSVMSMAMADTPARELLTSLQSEFSLRELANQTVWDNVRAFTLPDTITTMTGDEVSISVAQTPYNFSVFSMATKKLVTAPLAARPTTAQGYTLFIRKDGVVIANNVTWRDFYLASATFQEDSNTKFNQCNATTISNYIADLADKSYRGLPNRDDVDKLGRLMGVTGVDLAQQLIITTSRPLLVELCNTTQVLPNTTSGSAGLQSILDDITQTTFQAERRGQATAGSNDTISRALAQRQKLARSSARTLSFYRNLRRAFRWGANVGAVGALGVSLVSMAVIMGVYKKAVLRLRRQLAIEQLLEEHPEGRLLMQGTTLAQKKLVVEAYGLDDPSGGGSQDSALRMFTMLERLGQAKMTMVIFFYGIVFSTVLLQLLVCTAIFGFLLTALFHPWFWSAAFPYVASWLLAFVSSQLIVTFIISGAIGQRIAPGDRITAMSPWLAYFIVFSFAYIILGVFLAAVRLALILLSAVVMSCRIDVCLNMLSRLLDPAYSAFLSMMKMQAEMKRFSDEELVGGGLEEGRRNALLAERM